MVQRARSDIMYFPARANDGVQTRGQSGEKQRKTNMSFDLCARNPRQKYCTGVEFWEYTNSTRLPAPDATVTKTTPQWDGQGGFLSFGSLEPKWIQET